MAQASPRCLTGRLVAAAATPEAACRRREKAVPGLTGTGSYVEERGRQVALRLHARLFITPRPPVRGLADLVGFSAQNWTCVPAPRVVASSLQDSAAHGGRATSDSRDPVAHPLVRASATPRALTARSRRPPQRRRRLGAGRLGPVHDSTPPRVGPQSARALEGAGPATGPDRATLGTGHRRPHPPAPRPRWPPPQVPRPPAPHHRRDPPGVAPSQRVTACSRTAGWRGGPAHQLHRGARPARQPGLGLQSPRLVVGRQPRHEHPGFT